MNLSLCQSRSVNPVPLSEPEPVHASRFLLPEPETVKARQHEPELISPS